MTDTPIPAVEVQGLETATANFETLLTADGNNRGPLWLAWHYLQVYSTWGLRVPNSEAQLSTKLGIADPGSYAFFPGMLESYQKVYNASKFFQEDVFPKVVSLGQALKNFGEQATNDGGNMFSAVVSLVDTGDSANALTLLNDLQQEAKTNAASAGEVTKKLNAYADQLTAAEKALADTGSAVNQDSRTSQDRIGVLSAGEDVPGSIAYLKKSMVAINEEYMHDVVVASTTPTYGWWIPFGTIAAAIVAGVYGDRAMKALAEYEKTKAVMDSESHELTIALATFNVQQLAQEGVSRAYANTQVAISQTNLVQNAWEGISSNLEAVRDKLLNMTTITDDDVKIRAKALVKNYAKIARDKWSQLMPAILELTENPYIVVEFDEAKVNQLIADIKSELNHEFSNN